MTTKKSLALIMLLSTSCLTVPTRADAAPLTAFVGGFLNAMGAGTWLASGAVGAWGAGFSVGSFFGGSLIARTLLGIGLSSLIENAVRPKQPAPSSTMTNYAQPLSYQERGYGRVRKGGPFAFTARKGTARHYGVLIAAHRTKGLVSHWLDKREVTIDGSGNVLTAPIAGYANLRTYRGLSGQATDSVWQANFPEVTSAHNYAGLSYVACTATKPGQSIYTQVMPSGREWVLAPVWDMDDWVFDPRDGLRKWTDNLALVIGREAERFGKTVQSSVLIREANICDIVVSNGDGGTQKQWTFNGIFDSSMSWETVRSALMLAGDVFFYEDRDGNIGFRVGAYSAPTVTLTDTDFLSLTINEGQLGPSVPGEFVTRYVEPSREYLETPSGAIILDNNGRRDEIEAYGINSHNQACRVANRMGKVARAKYRISGTIKIIGQELVGQRFFRITHAELGYDIICEINKLAKNRGGASFTFSAVSTSAADFAFDAATQEPARPLYVVVASDGAVTPPASLSGTVITGTGGIPIIEWDWPTQPEGLTQQIRLRSTAAGLPEWQIIGAGEGQSSYLAQGLIDGAAYEAQVRNVSGGGRVSDWAPTTPIVVTAVADTAAPAALQTFSAAASGGNGVITYKAPNSKNYAATRIYRAAGGSPFSSAVLIRTEYGSPNTNDSYTHVAPGSGSHSYWGQPVNGSGIPGPLSGPATITIP